MNDKKRKVRTSITIDPDLLHKARAVADDEDMNYKSVSHLIETALLAHIKHVPESYNE